jgi:Uma2 family endonuclease
MVAASPLRQATAADLARLPPDVRAEVIGGEIVEKAAPSAEHADAQGGVIVCLRGPYHRRPGGDQPGGWWILPEVEIELAAHEVYRPDIAGWRRERVPERPRGQPVMIRPDWVCEVLSPSNASNDLVKKLGVYHRTHIDHYWIVDPQNETLTVLRWTPDGYLAALTAGRADRVRAEPFDAVELPVGVLFGDEEA